MYNELGSGFVESIYEKALMIELESIGLFVESQKEIKVYYKGLEVGIFKSDIIVENKVIKVCASLRQKSEKRKNEEAIFYRDSI